MTEAVALAPVDARQRLHTLDVLRRFALFGIALMNVEYFGRPPADVGNGVDHCARDQNATIEKTFV